MTVPFDVLQSSCTPYAIDPVAQRLTVHTADSGAAGPFIPSNTAAGESRQRLWLACRENAARRRGEEAVTSPLSETAARMTRILAARGIIATAQYLLP